MTTGTGLPVSRVTEGYAPAIDVTALISEALHIVVVDLEYTDSSGVIFSVPADCVVMFSIVVVDTVWDAAPTLTVGVATDLDSLVRDYEHKLDDAGPSFVVRPYHAAGATDIYATWNQNGASQGAAQLIVFYYQR